MTRVLGPLVAVGIMLAVSSAPAVAQTSGSETIDGVVVSSGASGTRQVLSSVVVAKGVFQGVGRIVERENLPGDPANAARDDLVFADGTLHILNLSLGASFSLNPRSCTAVFIVQQATTVEGGTGRFTGASGSFTGTVTGRGLARRNPDGSCALDQAPLHEVDKLTGSGSLSL